MSKHTEGKWVVDYGGTIGHIKAIKSQLDKDTPTVCKYDPCPGYPNIPVSEKEKKANAHRIVACVNSLNGIPNSALENDVIGDMRELAKEVTECGVSHGLMVEAKAILTKLEGGGE